MVLKELLSFLKELKANNEKAWFDAHKKQYESLRKEWILLVEQAIKKVGAFDKDVALLEPKKCIFRINRDIRFSKDKSPYKTNFGMSLSKIGKKDNFCGYYLHIEPGNSFVAGGVYLPMPDKLAAIRQEIDYNLDAFESIVGKADFKSSFGKLSGESLQRPPKGYDINNPALPYLKLKSFIAEKKFSDKEVCAPDFTDQVYASFKKMYPLTQFLSAAMHED